MKQILMYVATCTAFLATSALAADGMTALTSPYNAKETMDRMEAAAKAKGQMVFARVDHAAGAAKTGKTLRPTEVLIFGNPVGGTPLMECAQSAGIDLPQKALVWEDGAGQVWIAYNDPAFLARRHGVPECAAIASLQKALAAMVADAVAK